MSAPSDQSSTDTCSRSPPRWTGFSTGVVQGSRCKTPLGPPDSRSPSSPCLCFRLGGEWRSSNDKRRCCRPDPFVAEMTLVDGKTQSDLGLKLKHDFFEAMREWYSVSLCQSLSQQDMHKAVHPTRPCPSSRRSCRPFRSYASVSFVKLGFDLM